MSSPAEWVKKFLSVGFLLISVVTWLYTQEETQVRLLSGVEVFLPENSPVRIHWVLPPVDQTLIENRGHQLCFSIDAEGFPWIGVSGRMIINPAKKYFGVLTEYYYSFTHLENGVLFLADEEDFGFIAATDDLEYDEEIGYPFLVYQSLAPLPGLENEGEKIISRSMHRGANCLYFIVRKNLEGEEYAEKYEIYCLRPGALNREEDKPESFPEFIQIYESERPITAVSGNGETTFVAHGQLVLKIDESESKPVVYYRHPTDLIMELDFTEEAGLFYSTNYSVGLISEGRALEFMRAPSPRIFLRGDSLYVMLSEQAAVLQVEKAAFLRGYNSISREVVAVNGVSFSPGWTSFHGFTSFWLLLLAAFLLFIVLIDVLRNQFSGYSKTIWVMMVFLSYLALVLSFFQYMIFGLKSGWRTGLLVLPYLTILVYLITGRAQKLKNKN